MDVPPEVAARALELLPADLAAARLNLVAPPMTWLVAQAAELSGGRLTGALTAGRGLVVFDGIQVPPHADGSRGARLNTGASGCPGQ